jgi:hypothetical protein
MSVATRKVRKHLSADMLFRLLHSIFSSVPDPRVGEVEIPLDDALMSAFAMFSLKDPSLLAFDHRRRDPNDNFRTIYGINRVPSDSQMRAILDPVDPTGLRAPFLEIFRLLQRSKGFPRKYSRLDSVFLVEFLPCGLGFECLSQGGDDERSHGRGNCVVPGCRPEVDRTEAQGVPGSGDA